MTASTGEREELVERLRRKRIVGYHDLSRGCEPITELLNPDGPEAADAIESLTRPGLKEALDHIRARILVVLGGERDGMSAPSVKAFQEIAEECQALASVENHR